jgi:hypothetical protein
VAALAGRRVLLSERAADGLRLVSVGAEGQARKVLATLPSKKYQGAGKALQAGDAIFVEAALAPDGRKKDVYALGSAAPVLLAEGAELVAAAGDRAAFLQAGNLRSAKLDGSAAIALGGGDGLDEVADESGDRVLLTLHGAGKGDVRAVSLDGKLRVDVAQPGADETAFALSGGRAILERAGATGSVIVSVALDGSGERALTTPEQGAIARLVGDGGLVIFESGGGALMAVDAAGAGPARTLDPAAGTDIVVSRIVGDRVVYTGTGATALALRAAKLDGSGVTTLCEQVLWLPYFSGVTPDGRVVFHRALAGQLEGGQAFSVKLDGTELRQFGSDVRAADGSRSMSPFDQDFEAVTPSGRVILEAEFEGLQQPQLVLASPQASAAALLAQLDGLKFAAVIP